MSLVARLLAVASLVSLTLFSASAATGDAESLEVVHKIKVEAFDRSKVMDTLSALTDRYGPRLTGSPEFDEAAEWAMTTLKNYGIADVHEEKWGPFGRSWSLQGYTLEMVAPRYSHLVSVPLAWSGPTQSPGTAEALYAPFRITNWYDLATNKEALARYKNEWKGKLKGRVVLATEIPRLKASEQPLFTRDTPTRLTELAQAPDPAVRRDVPIDEIKVPSDREEAQKYMASLPPDVVDQMYDRYIDLVVERSNFYREEGAVAVVNTDRRAHNGLLFAEQASSHKSATPLPLPSFVIPEEQYSRMVRLLDRKQAVSLRYAVQAKISDKDVDAKNIIGEIKGVKRPDEIVMIGAHFDSWHSGTGATDNGAGSAVMIEVMRVLKRLNLPLDRTVRIGLWSGEEQGLLGSKAYIAQHFGDPKTMQLKPEHAKFDAYLNLDNGSGKIRGVYLQGNDAARPLFTKWLQPFSDMGVGTISLKNTGGTDHLSFDAVGLPGFQFIQDPLDYGTVTHHSDMDTYSHAVPEDLMQASAVIATLVYDIANQPDALPRKPLPARLPQSSN